MTSPTITPNKSTEEMPNDDDHDYTPVEGGQKMKWKAMFNKLKAYKGKHGNCLVPQRYAEDPKLGRWVNKQRENKASLSSERKELLDSIGFVWSVVLREPWEAMFERLCKYREQHGNCLVPQRYDLDPRLGGWVREQRKRKASLTKQRRDYLDAIGFAWRVKDHQAQESLQQQQQRHRVSQSRAIINQQRVAALRSELFDSNLARRSLTTPQFVDIRGSSDGFQGSGAGVNPHLRASIFSERTTSAASATHSSSQFLPNSAGGTQHSSGSYFGLQGAPSAAQVGAATPSIRGAATASSSERQGGLMSAVQHAVQQRQARNHRANVAAALYPISPESKVDEMNLDLLVEMRMRRERLLAELTRRSSTVGDADNRRAISGGSTGQLSLPGHQQSILEEQKTSELSNIGTWRSRNVAGGMSSTSRDLPASPGQQPLPTDYPSLAAFRRANPDYPNYPWAA